MDLMTLNQLNQHLIFYARDALGPLGVMTGSYVLNQLLQGRLNQLGIRPRRLRGLWGIFVSPFLHASFDHLFFNAIPFYVLFTFLLAEGGWIQAVYVSLCIILFGGLMTWLLGRRAIHVGSSGWIMGMMGYILSECYLQRSLASWILGMLALYYLGSILLSLFPSEEHVSFEGHIFGFASGIMVSWKTFPSLYHLAYTLTPYLHHALQIPTSF